MSERFFKAHESDKKYHSERDVTRTADVGVNNLNLTFSYYDFVPVRRQKVKLAEVNFVIKLFALNRKVGNNRKV